MNNKLARNLALSFLALSLLIAACAPAAGRSVIRYNAPAEEIVATIAGIAPNLRPSSSYNYYSIVAISERSITLQADTTGGVSFFFGGGTVRVTFTAAEVGGVTNLAVSTEGGGDDTISAIIQQLDAEFTRVS